MANTRTLGDLITGIRQRADMVGSTFVDDFELTDYVNQAVAELHNLLATTYEDYYVKASDPYTLPGTDSNVVLTGSINPTASTAVVGVGTKFLTELAVGVSILVSDETRIVDTIVNDTALTVTVAFTDTANDTTPEKIVPFGTLPSDFYKCLGVDLALGGRTHTLKAYMFNERNVLTSDMFYRIQGTKIVFLTEAATAGTATLWYIPEPAYFSPASPLVTTQVLGTVDPQIQRGYEEFIILDAAVKCLIKEESDAKTLIALREMARQRIEDVGSVRVPGSPYRIADAGVDLGRNLL